MPAITDFIGSITEGNCFATQTQLKAIRKDNGEITFSTGAFAIVVKMQNHNKIMAMKCFYRHHLPQNQLQQRYQAIHQELQKYNSPYFLEFQYLDKELIVTNDYGELLGNFPILLMEWIEGDTLGSALKKLCQENQKIALQYLAKQFDQMALWLLEQPFAHGDIKPDNILLRDDHQLVLVDYDGMFVPQLQHQKAIENGTLGFIHPQRSQEHFAQWIDDFSLLLLSLTLHALAYEPALYQYCHPDTLLFTPQDLTQLTETPICQTLRSLQAEHINLRLALLEYALSCPPQAILPLKHTLALQPKTTYSYHLTELIPTKNKQGKFGFCDKNKNIIIPYIYDAIGDCSEGLTLVKQNGKWGCLDITGNQVIPCIYEYAHKFRDGLALVKRAGKYGYVDTAGKEVVPCVYDDVDLIFYEGLARVRRAGKWGYVDTAGKEAVPCVYDKAYDFSEGLALVRRAGKWGYVDTTGKEAVPCVYDKAYAFREGLARVKRAGKWGYVDTAGKEAVPCVYDDAYAFSEGLALVQRAGKWGYVDTTGKEILPCVYDDAYDFREGLAWVRRAGKWGWIDKTGKEVLPRGYDDVNLIFYEGLALEIGRAHV